MRWNLWIYFQPNIFEQISKHIQIAKYICPLRMSCRAVQAVEFAKTSLAPKLWCRRPAVQQHTPTGDDPAKAVSRRPLDEKRKLPEQIGSVFFLVLRERLFNGYCKQVAMVTNGVTLFHFDPKPRVKNAPQKITIQMLIRWNLLSNEGGAWQPSTYCHSCIWSPATSVHLCHTINCEHRVSCHTINYLRAISVAMPESQCRPAA